MERVYFTKSTVVFLSSVPIDLENYRAGMNLARRLGRDHGLPHFIASPAMLKPEWRPDV
jgi:hypothetical protein